MDNVDLCCTCICRYITVCSNLWLTDKISCWVCILWDNNRHFLPCTDSTKLMDGTMLTLSHVTHYRCTTYTHKRVGCHELFWTRIRVSLEVSLHYMVVRLQTKPPAHQPPQIRFQNNPWQPVLTVVVVVRETIRKKNFINEINLMETMEKNDHFNKYQI